MGKLKGEAVVFTNTKCAICRGKLELNQDAAIHFLCGCSFHYQCFQAAAAETRDKCPKCFTENQDIVSKINAAAEQLQNTSIHDSFHLQLFKARGDRFSVVAEHFSRGLFRGRSGHPMKVKTMRSSIAPHLGGGEGDPANVREEKPVKVERLIVPKSSARSNAFSGSTSIAAKSSTGGRSQTSATSLPVDQRKSSRNVSPVAAASYASSSGNPFVEDKDFDEEDGHNPFGTTPDGASEVETRNQRSPYQPSNPFGDPVEEARPTQDVTSNPFGEPDHEDEYDEAKNPFAE